MQQWQTRTIEVNGVNVTYKVTNNLKRIQVFVNDNFALAEDFLCFNSMLAGLLHYREMQHRKGVRLGAKVNRFHKISKASATINITLCMQSEVVKQIVNQIKKEKDERRKEKF